VTRFRIFVFILACVAVLCLLGVRPTQTQSVLRRITNTTEEGININPSLSGDGRIVAFESTEDIAGAGGADHFRAIRANVAVDPITLFEMGGTRAVAAAISQDGARIAFASKDDPLGTNPDGNSEIFLFDGARLIQVTNTSPGDIANRVPNGNFQPSISDDGRFIAFSSNRDPAGQNDDGNLEIFIYDTVATTFTQLTNSSGTVGSSDAKISGNGAQVAFARDTGSRFRSSHGNCEPGADAPDDLRTRDQRRWHAGCLFRRDGNQLEPGFSFRWARRKLDASDYCAGHARHRSAFARHHQRRRHAHRLCHAAKL
jgi:Tol biopolymer transport system component